MSNNQKIKKMSAPDLVCERIKENISNGIWSCFQKLPPESDLAEMFGVNRLTVRIALQKLNTLGVLDTRVGDGTYVCQFDFNQHIEEISEFYITPALLDDVSEFRMLIEVESARLAIQRGTPEELDSLRICCMNFESAIINYFKVENDPTASEKERLDAFFASNEADLTFHHQICIMAHNSLLLYSFAVAKPAFRNYMMTIANRRLPYIIVNGQNTSVQDHWAIYNAIRRKDFDACRKLYIQMIDYNNLSPIGGEDGLPNVPNS